MDPDDSELDDSPEAAAAADRAREIADSDSISRFAEYEAAPVRGLMGRALVSCPVDGCEWAIEEADANALAAAARYTIRPDLPWDEAVSVAVSEAAQRQASELETQIRAHAESHDVLDFLRTIQRLRMDLAQQNSGIRPHRY